MARLFHQRLRLGQIEARCQRLVVAEIALGAHLRRGGAETLHDLLGDAPVVDRIGDRLAHPDVLEGLDPVLVHLQGDDAGAGHGDQIDIRIGVDARHVARRHRGDEVDIARQQRRHPGRGLGDRREHDLVDIAGRGGVPVVGEALELDPHALLAVGDDERPGAGGVLRSEAVAMFDDLGAALVELAVHGEDVGGVVQHQRERPVGDDVDGVVVDHVHRHEGHEDALEVGRAFEPLEGPQHIGRGQGVAGVELDPLAQVEAHGGGVETLPALGDAALEAQRLGPAHQRIEQHVRKLQGAAGELLVRVQRDRIGVIGHRQRLGIRKTGAGQGDGNDRGPGDGTEECHGNLPLCGFIGLIGLRGRSPFTALSCDSANRPVPIITVCARSGVVNPGNGDLSRRYLTRPDRCDGSGAPGFTRFLPVARAHPARRRKRKELPIDPAWAQLRPDEALRRRGPDPAVTWSRLCEPTRT